MKINEELNFQNNLENSINGKMDLELQEDELERFDESIGWKKIFFV